MHWIPVRNAYLTIISFITMILLFDVLTSEIWNHSFVLQSSWIFTSNHGISTIWNENRVSNNWFWQSLESEMTYICMAFGWGELANLLVTFDWRITAFWFLVSISSADVLSQYYRFDDERKWLSLLKTHVFFSPSISTQILMNLNEWIEKIESIYV